MADPANNLPDEDEDLFDFPDMMPDMSQAAAAAGAPVASEVSLDGAEVDAPAVSQEPRDELDAPAAPLPSPAPAAAMAAQPAAAPAARALVPPKPAPEFDPEADADLFRFDELFQPGDSLGELSGLSHADLLEPQLGGPTEAPPQSAPGTPAPSPKPAAAAATPVATGATGATGTTGAPLPAAPGAPGAAAPAAARSSVLDWAATGLAPIGGGARRLALDAARAARVAAERQLELLAQEDDEGLRPRLPLIAAAVLFISLNAAMLFFAWRASTQLEATLDGVRIDVARTLSSVGGSGEVMAEERSDTAGSALQPGDSAGPATKAVEGYGAIELRAAREEIQLGEFVAARLRLFRLLANRDRGPLEDAVVADAEYTVARSYFIEGQRLEGIGR